MRDFYLFPEDLGDEPLYYRCTYLKEVVYPDHLQKVWIVKVSPCLPRWLKDYLPSFESGVLGLGIIDNSWTMRRIGEFGFIVDVFVIKRFEEMGKRPNLTDYSRFGTGVISGSTHKPQLNKND